MATLQKASDRALWWAKRTGVPYVVVRAIKGELQTGFYHEPAGLVPLRQVVKVFQPGGVY